MRVFLLAVLLVVSSAPPSEGQIFDRLRGRAERALDETSVLQRMLEEPPGITTSIEDAHTEIPFLDNHNPTATALMAALPRNAEHAFFAPPGLYEMDALSYCIQAGTYGPTGGDGYALAPLQGDLAPVLRTLMRASIEHPDITQADIQSLIWALQARAPLDELSPEIQDVAYALLNSEQIDRLSEGVVDQAKEVLMEEALERVPESVRRVAEVQAELRRLLRQGADFEELEAAAVLVGVPSMDELVREVPGLRWNYHPDGYFIRFDPEDYTLTHIQTYVPEVYRLVRDGKGRVQELVGPRGVRLTFQYGTDVPGMNQNLAALAGISLTTAGGIAGEWAVDGWTFVGDDMGGDAPTESTSSGAWEARREAARSVRRQAREVVASVRGEDAGRPSRDLADLSNLRTGLLEAQGAVPEEALIHLTNAWQYTLCGEAGGCAGQQVAQAEFPETDWINGGLHGPMAGPAVSFYEPIPGMPLLKSGGGTSVDAGGNVAAPGNTGSQRLLPSGRTPVEKANLAMKALGVLVALADVLASSGLGSAAYNALGMGGLPVGHLGLPTMMAGAMISEVVGVWSTATDALAGDTGGDGSGGDDGGSSDGGDEGLGTGGTGGVPVGEPFDPEVDPFHDDPAGGGGGWEDTRSDGDDYENTPPPSPPPPPFSPSPGGDVSPERMESYQDFSGALLTTLYHTQSLTDSRLRQEAAFQAGDTDWAETQADLAGDHQQQAAQGMMEVARALEALLDRAEAEGVLGSDYAFAEDLAGVQERLWAEGWSEEEMNVAGLLRITPAEMAGLQDYLLTQDPEVMAGDLVESARLWAKEMRTAGILWMALPQLNGGGG